MCYHDIADIDRVCSTYGTLYRPIGQGLTDMKTHRENRTLAEKQRDIKNLLMTRADGSNPAWLSTNELASGIGMARNGRFKAMLDWMVLCGSLQVRECERSGRWPGYEYAVSEVINRFYNRPVVVKSRGKKVGQLEMFNNV